MLVCNALLSPFTPQVQQQEQLQTQLHSSPGPTVGAALSPALSLDAQQQQMLNKLEFDMEVLRRQVELQDLRRKLGDVSSANPQKPSRETSRVQFVSDVLAAREGARSGDDASRAAPSCSAGPYDASKGFCVYFDFAARLPQNSASFSLIFALANGDKVGRRLSIAHTRSCCLGK
eukprot:m.276535 g.276535  ORF g.276535 m.276535 type:complete len:175 (+) comp19365_c0_seq14:157-681(+)